MFDESTKVDAEFSVAPPASKTAPPVVIDPSDVIFKRAAEFKRTIDTAYIGLGRELYQIFHRRLFIDKGFDTFDDYLENGLGMSRDRGGRVRRIWTKFIKELNLRAEQLEGIGYTRALALISVISSSNVDEWLDKARNLTWRSLTQQIAIAKNPSDATLAAAIASGATIKRIVEEDDEDLSGEGGFDEIPSGGGGGALPSERSGLTASGPSPDRRRPPTDFDAGPSSGIGGSRTEILKPKRTTVTLKLTDDQLDTWNAAIDEARRAKPTEVSHGECVAHVALEFMANRTTKGESAISRVNFFLGKFQLVYGGKFIWIKDDDAAAVLMEAVAAHPHLFEEAVVPTTTVIKEDRVDHEHPDESPHADDEHDAG